MQPDNKSGQTSQPVKQTATRENHASGNSNVDENVKAALETAEADIEKDPELSIHSPNDDLDEGEIARLGDDNTDLV